MRGQKTEKPSARFFLPHPARSAASLSVFCLPGYLSSVSNQKAGFQRTFQRTEDRETERSVFPPSPGA
ncbi:MAG: hypothetical protein LBD06_01250 [Candidatus Accumulibacter sp.]|nr:hypothetical protein [Accumulibacter sp.]